MRETIQKLPKADVHNHLHLSGSVKALKKKYAHREIHIPLYYNGLEGMIDFIVNYINNIMLTSDDVIFFMESAIESSIADNVEYLEASVDVGLVRYFDQSIERLIEEVDKLKKKYRSQITFRPDIGINKHYEIDKAYSDGLKCIKSGIYNGIDLYGKEHDQDLRPYIDLYKMAKEENLKTKIHIGEFSDHNSIEEAIFLFDPDEIQHGINAAESKSTMDMILERNIRLNVCPQSNIALGTVQDLNEHPIRKLFDHEIKLTINTDDLLLFDATITDQMSDLIEKGIFSPQEMEKIRINSFD